MDRRINTLHRRGIQWIASYPKSGNTWVRMFIEALARIQLTEVNRFDINRLENVSDSDRDIELYRPFIGGPITDLRRAEIAAARPRVQAELARSRGLKIVKTHNARIDDHGYPLIGTKPTVGAIYLIRNPLDVAVSFARFRKLEIDAVVAEMADPAFGRTTQADVVYFVTGSWSDHVRSWTSGGETGYPVLALRYEDLLDAPETGFRSIADHIFARAGDDQVTEAVALSSFDRLQAMERRDGFLETYGSSRFFRKGVADQWREVLTPAQIERIVADHHDEMERFGYLP